MYNHRRYGLDGQLQKYSTGISKLDDLLKGGLNPGNVVEIYGRSATGKSLLSQTILKECCRNPNKLTALYIDTKNDLIPSRLFDTFDRCSQIMRRVRVARESTLENVLQVLKFFEQEIIFGQSRFCEQLRIIVVDSLPMLLYGVKAKDTGTWNTEVEKFMTQINGMASKYGLVIILINHAVTQYSAGEFNFRRQSSSSCGKSSTSSETIKPALGKIWQPVPNFRILLTRSSAGLNIMYRGSLEKSNISESNTYFEFRINEHRIE